MPDTNDFLFSFSTLSVYECRCMCGPEVGDGIILNLSCTVFTEARISVRSQSSWMCLVSLASLFWGCQGSGQPCPLSMYMDSGIQTPVLGLMTEPSLQSPCFLSKLSTKGNAFAILLIALCSIFFAVNKNENYLPFYRQLNWKVLRDSPRKPSDDPEHYHTGGLNEKSH